MIGRFPVEWVVALIWLAAAVRARSSPPEAIACLIAVAGFAVAGAFKILRVRRERGNHQRG